MNEDAGQVAALEAQLKRKSDEMNILTRVALQLGGTLDLGPLLDIILASMDEVFGFQHSMVLLFDATTEVLVVAASRGYEATGVGAEVPIGTGVIGVVAKRRKLMKMGGVSAQRSYAEASGASEHHDASVVGLPGLPDVASVIAIPLLKREELIGVFYVESAKLAAFDDHDLALVEAVASQAAIAIQNARYLEAEVERSEQLQHANQELVEWNAATSRFVPYEFLSIIGRDRLTEVCRGDHAERQMSTFFSDVRNYTTMVEGQGPAENFAFINEYLTFMEEPIRSHDGFIDSYRGDGIMALFAGTCDDPVQAAIDSLRALSRLNDVREQRGDTDIRVGIGIDTGHLMLGTIGGAERLSAGVIGDSTNTAARIEALTKRYAAPILVSENTLGGCADPDRYQTRLVDRVRPKGKTNPIAIHEVLDGLDGAELDGKLASREDFVHGIELYQAGEPGEALVCFAAALKTYPADRAAQLYIGRCWNLIEHGLPDDWDGVATLAE